MHIHVNSAEWELSENHIQPTYRVYDFYQSEAQHLSIMTWDGELGKKVNFSTHATLIFVRLMTNNLAYRFPT